MAKTQEIKSRIKSVNSTKKITRAMEMVAATKMRKCVESVLKTRTYANLSWTTVLNVAHSINAQNLHPLLKKPEKEEKIAVVLISSNRGLCGSFNTNIINKAHNSVKKHKDKQTDFITIGSKGLLINQRHGYNIVAQFSKNDIAYKIKEVTPVARLIIDDFLKKKYDKVMVAYTDFVSVAKQITRVKQILPIDLNAKDDHLGIVGQSENVGITKEYAQEKEDKYLKTEDSKYIFTYEPDAYEVLDEMLPRLIEVQLFQALLESNASEHSGRMSAMNKATDAANDLVNELTLFYNKARQASITSEIAEISAGANSLEK